MRVCNFIFIFLIVMIAGCNTEKNNDFTLPEIMIETVSDTVKIGENYSAKIFISDTSFYRLYLNNNKSYRVEPIIKFNNQQLEVVDDTALFHFEVLIDSLNSQEAIVERQWTASLMFPHPKGGDVTLSKFIKYYVDQRKK